MVRKWPLPGTKKNAQIPMKLKIHDTKVFDSIFFYYVLLSDTSMNCVMPYR